MNFWERHTKKISRILKTDMHYVMRNGFFVGATSITNSLAGLFLVYIFATFVPKETYGTYKYILSVIGMLGVFTLNDMENALIRAISKGYEKTFHTGIKSLFKYNTFVTVLAAIAASYYWTQNNHLLAYGIFIGGLLFPFYTTAKLYTAILTGKKKFRTQTFYNVPRILIPSIATGIAAFLNTPLIVIIAIYFGSQTCTNILIFILVTKTNKLSGPDDKETLSYSKHLSALNILGSFAAKLDNIIIFQYVGSSALATYAIARVFPDQLQIFKNIIKSLALPKMSARDYHKIVPTLSRRYTILFVLFATMVAVYIITAPYIYSLLFPHYMEAVVYSQVLSLVLMSGPITIYMQALLAHAKKKELYIVQTVIPITRICLYIVLLPLLGLWGIIATTLSVTALQSVLIIYLVHKNVQTKPVI